MRYNKTPLTTAEQIKLLKERGLHIEDKALASHYLQNISYYRLKGYWWSLQSDKKKHIFKEESNFQTVIDLYNFDRELRLLAFNMVERIEIGVRTQLIYHLSITESPWWFENPDLFKNRSHWFNNLKQLSRELIRSNEVFMKEHHKKYNSDDRNPPAWKSFEVVSMGMLSKFFASLKNNHPGKKAIVSALNMGNHTFLESWLRNVTTVRNICAHHSRLWNRNLPTPPKLLKKASLPWITKEHQVDVNSFYAVFLLMYYLLQTISPDNQFKDRLKQLLTKYPNIDQKAMGFPNDWESQPIFKE